jgi:hypothetical protein
VNLNLFGGIFLRRLGTSAKRVPSIPSGTSPRTFRSIKWNARRGNYERQEANMNIKALRQSAAIAGLAGVLSLAAVTSSSAAPHWGGHWGGGAAIGAGVAGFALGAAAASGAGPYYGYDGYYDYAPGPVVVDPGPAYYDYDAAPYYAAPYYAAPGYPLRRPGRCGDSVRGC